MGYQGNYPPSTPLNPTQLGTGVVTTDAIANGAVVPADLSTGGPYWNTSGNVGIGTSSPNLSSSSTALTVNTGTAANYSVIELASAGALNFYINANNAASYIVSAGTRPMVFYTNASERMRIDSSGNAFIGNTAATWDERLGVRPSGVGTVGIGVYSSSASYTGSLVRAQAENATGANFKLYEGRGSGGGVNYWVDGAGGAYFAGNVGIGTTSPSASLSVVKQTTALSGTGNSYGLYMYPTSSGLTYIDAITGSTGNTSLGFRTYNNGTYNEMRMDSSGNVGIGTSSPANKLDVNGSISDSIGNVRSIPQNSQTTGYTLVASDNGKHISITTGGVTVPASVFSVGQVVSVYNNSASNQTITQGATVTLRQAGTANTGNRTLAQYGVCTILCVASNTFVISGAGLS